MYVCWRVWNLLAHTNGIFNIPPTKSLIFTSFRLAIWSSPNIPLCQKCQYIRIYQNFNIPSLQFQYTSTRNFNIPAEISIYLNQNFQNTCIRNFNIPPPEFQYTYIRNFNILQSKISIYHPEFQYTFPSKISIYQNSIISIYFHQKFQYTCIRLQYTGPHPLRTSKNFKNQYKFEFWCREKVMPIFEEISMSRIQEKC